MSSVVLGKKEAKTLNSASNLYLRVDNACQLLLVATRVVRIGAK